MNTVTSITQFADLISAFTASHTPVQTNCFLWPEELRTLIEGGGVRYLQCVDDLLFGVAEQGYSRLFYYTATLAPVDPARLVALSPDRQPIILDLITRSSAAASAPPIQDKWLSSGFHVYGRFQRMRRTARENLSAEHLAALDGDYRIERHDMNRLPFIQALWAQCLDPYSTPLPTADALSAPLAEGHITYLLTADDILCAAMMARPHGKKVTIQHVSVHPDYRRRGLARRLLTASMQADQAENTTEWMLWVDEKNHPAIQLYHSLGFVPDGMISVQLMLQP